MANITQIAFDPTTGITHQRTGSRPYKFCVVSPSKWRREGYVEAWTASGSPRVRPGDRVLPVRVVTDKVELAELAMLRAQSHLYEQVEELSRNMGRAPSEYQTQEMLDRWIVELQQRVAVATKSLDAALTKLKRLKAKIDQLTTTPTS